MWPKCLTLLVRPAGFEPATYGFVDEARLAKLLKSLEPEKTKLLVFCPNLQPIRNHFPRSAKLTSRVVDPPTHPPFDPNLTSIFKNKEAPLSPWRP